MTWPRALVSSGQLLLLLAFSLLSQQAAAQAGGDSLPPSHSLLFETANVAGTVRVNGIPVIRHTLSGGSESSGASLNPFLKPGPNRIDIQLDAPKEPEFPGSRPVFHIAVRTGEESLISLKQAAPDITLPYSKTLSFEVKSFPDLPLWKATPPPPLDRSRKEITAALNALSAQMRTALKRKDRKAVFAVFGLLMEGKQIARGGALAGIGISDVYETLDSLAEEELPPVKRKEQDLSFESLPSTNLYVVAGTASRAAVGFRFPNGQDRGAYRVLMGKVNGKWQILGQLSR